MTFCSPAQVSSCFFITAARSSVWHACFSSVDGVASWLWCCFSRRSATRSCKYDGSSGTGPRQSPCPKPCASAPSASVKWPSWWHSESRASLSAHRWSGGIWEIRAQTFWAVQGLSSCTWLRGASLRTFCPLPGAVCNRDLKMGRKIEEKMRWEPLERLISYEHHFQGCPFFFSPCLAETLFFFSNRCAFRPEFRFIVQLLMCAPCQIIWSPNPHNHTTVIVFGSHSKKFLNIFLSSRLHCSFHFFVIFCNLTINFLIKSKVTLLFVMVIFCSTMEGLFHGVWLIIYSHFFS